MKVIKGFFINPVNIAWWSGLNVVIGTYLFRQKVSWMSVIGVIILILSCVGYGYAYMKHEAEKKNNEK